MKRTIDIDALLTPIPGENPAGEDLRYTPVYDDIKEARRADDAFPWEVATRNQLLSLGQVISISLHWKRGQGPADCRWLAVVVATDGFNGLAAGIRIMAGHMEHFWDTVCEMED
jgi:predicted component of type VI protein secretion system